MKPAIGGILLVTALVALVGLVVAAGSSMNGALTTQSRPAQSQVKMCAEACTEVSLTESARCSRLAESCDLACRGNYLDEGERILCQTRCPSVSPCLRAVITSTKACVESC